MKTLHRSPQFVALLVLPVALTLSLSLNPGEAATIKGSFELGIDQNLIVLDGTANIKNLQAALAKAALNGDDTTDLQDSLDVALRDDLVFASTRRVYTSVLLEREYPGLLLSNGANSNANIVGVKISLGNTSNQFMPFGDGKYVREKIASGEYKLFDMNTYNFQRVDPDKVSISASALASGRRLELSFSNGGIKPGRATTFNIYSSTGMQLEKFFDDNSRITVIYENPETNGFVSTGAMNLDKINVLNGALTAQLVSGTDGGSYFLNSVEAYSVTASIGAVPEPTSLLLLLGSGLGYSVLRRCRKAY